MAINNQKQYSWWDDRNSIIEPNPHKSQRLNNEIFATPKTLYEYLDSKLYGCEEYKKAMATAIWSSIHLRTKTNFLIIGPSGCGKTELARIFAEVYCNSTLYDATTVSPVTYKGNCTMSDCLLQVDTREEAPPPWVFIDEIDKAILKGGECASMIMNELLKLTEGGELYVGKDEKSRMLVNTSRVNFVFLGTFEALRIDQKNSMGFSVNSDFKSKDSPISRDTLSNSDLLSNEFLGRINGGILQVEPMDEVKASALLSDRRYSPINRLEDLYHINIHVSDEKRQELVNMTSKYGVRGIYSELQSKINDAIFEDCTITSISL